MIHRTLLGIIAGILGALLLCAGGLSAIISGGSDPHSPNKTICVIPLGQTPPPISPPATGWQPIDRFDAQQVDFAATIASVGATTGIPLWGWIIAVATAIQESDLRNLPHGDRDSLGLFQQRPSQGWGTPQQLQDPVYAAKAFYNALERIPHWQTLPLTEAAQKVQKSAYPDAYADHEKEALLLINHILGLLDPSGTPRLTCTHPTGPWTQPVVAPIVSAFRTTQRPHHDGVDLAAPRGTPIKAASAGTITIVRCNIPPGYSCDIDGNTDIPGCGWYVDIEHPGAVITRYCHLLAQPTVTIGQHVNVGDIIGLVGSSGNSSGPHLHYEIHLGDHSSASAIDPVDYMRRMGAPLE